MKWGKGEPERVRQQGEGEGRGLFALCPFIIRIIVFSPL